MTELQRLYLQIKANDPTLPDVIAKRRAQIYFHRKSLPFNLSNGFQAAFERESQATGVSSQITYIAPPQVPTTPIDPSTNDYVENEYIDDYFE